MLAPGRSYKTKRGFATNTPSEFEYQAVLFTKWVADSSTVPPAEALIRVTNKGSEPVDADSEWRTPTATTLTVPTSAGEVSQL